MPKRNIIFDDNSSQLIIKETLQYVGSKMSKNSGYFALWEDIFNLNRILSVEIKYAIYQINKIEDGKLAF